MKQKTVLFLDERWRLLVLALVAMAIVLFAFNLKNKMPLNGRVEAATHAANKRQAEIDQRFKEGVAMLHAKQYDYALTAFHRVLQLNPQMPEAHVNAGFALLGLGQPKAASDFFNVATDLRPNQVNAYYGLGEALADLGNTFGAMQAMETYLHLASKDDPFRTKAEAAVWELRTKLEQEREQKARPAAQGSPGASPDSRGRQP